MSSKKVNTKLILKKNKKTKLKIIKKEKKKENKKETKKRNKKSKNSEKTSSKNKKQSLNELYKLLDEQSKLFNTNLSDPKCKTEQLHKIMNDIENLKTKIALQEEYKIYPSIYHPQFSKLISERDLFSLYSIPDKKREVERLFSNNKSFQDLKKIQKKVEKRDIFKLSFNQQFLKNFMSPSSHYRGLLIFHGTGVGKTCSAITIAEQMKDMISDAKNKIYVLKNVDFDQQLFELNKVKKGNFTNQCTGFEYVDKLNSIDKTIINNCIKDNEECDTLTSKAKKIINSYYTFDGMDTWARKTDLVINKKSKNKTPEQNLEYKINIIRRDFSDGVIIIDEAHHINSDNVDKRLVTRVLTDVLLYSKNCRLILLTATPMFDKPSNIISLINYLLINDKRTPLPYSVFDKEGYKMTQKGAKLLAEKSRGYISYLRGNNPFTFPTTLKAKVNIPNQILNLNKYPKIPTIFKDLNHDMRFLEIVSSPMGKIQKEVYKKVLNNKTATAWTEESQVSNFVYQSLKETDNQIINCYGKNGFKKLFNPRIGGKNSSYTFRKEEDGKKFSENLSEYSSKIANILKIIKESSKKGPIFIYSFYVESGLKPLVIALEMAGFLPYKSHSTPYIKNKYKNKEYQGDYIIKTGSLDEFTIKSSNINKYLNMRQSMVNEKNVKIFLGSQSASEGLSLFGYREIHILEPHFNLSMLQQAIGRTIRTGSHLHLPLEERNVTVYMHASTLPTEETVDLYKYRTAEKKAIYSGLVEKIMKENSIDCYINLHGNLFDDKLLYKDINMKNAFGKIVKRKLSDQPYSRECHYLPKCDYKCNTKKPDSKLKENLFLKDINRVINEIVLQIEDVLAHHKKIKILHLPKLINLYPKYNDFLPIAISKIINDKKIIIDSRKIESVPVVSGDFIMLLPTKNLNPDQEEILLHIPPKDNISKIDMKQYINQLKNNKRKININYEDYRTIMDDIQFKLDNFTYNNDDNKYFNVSLNKNESINFIVENSSPKRKIELCKNILMKKITNVELNSLEKIIFKNIKKNHIVYLSDINLIDSNSANNGGGKSKKSKKKTNKKYETKSQKKSQKKIKEIFGFLIAEYEKINLYVYKNKDFVLDNGNLGKILDKKINLMKKKEINKIHGMLKYEVGNKIAFKILDMSIDDKKSRKGVSCSSKMKNQIINYLKMISKEKINNKQKNIICSDLEYSFRILDTQLFKGKKWFLSPEEYFINNL